MKRDLIGMKRFSLNKVAALIALSGAAQAQALPLCVSGTVYSTVGDNSCTVPPGVTSMDLVVQGGNGGGGAGPSMGGGGGATLTVTGYSVTPGSTLAIFVGGAGSGSPSINHNGSGGGGSSQVNAGAPNQIIAGGGGGSGSWGYGGDAGTNGLVRNGSPATVIGGGGGGGGIGGAGASPGGSGSGGAGGDGNPASPYGIGGAGSGNGVGGSGGVDTISGGGGGGYGGGGAGSGGGGGGGGGSIGPVGSTTYQIRSVGSSGPSLSGHVQLTFVAGVVVAGSPDTGNATAGTAATPIANVLANDTVDGVPATTSNSTLTVVTPASDAGVVLDTATGAVTTTAAVPSGTYTITYQLCNKATPAVCATSTATVTVTAVVPTTGDGVSKVPTLSEYGLMMLSGLLAALGLPALRRRQHRNLNG